MAPLPDRRLLLVHAHPDDESIGTGATMARYAAEGVAVTLVTCTLGEEGEVLEPLYAELAADRGDQLGGYRIAELDAACAALGVTDHRYLGGPGRYRDSGMMGTPANDHPRAFWRADLDEAAGRLAAVVREVRPQVVVTYDANGFYGHPDHIQAHRVATRAVELAATGPGTTDGSGASGASDASSPADGSATSGGSGAVDGGPWRVPKVYWTTQPRSVLARGMEAFAASAENPFAGITRVEDLPFGVADDEVDARIDATPYFEAKMAALRAHATQISAGSWLYVLAANVGAEAMGVEHYTLAAGERGPGSGEHGWEDDLFAGLG